MRKIAMLVALMVIGAVAISAQETTGAITGQVLDPKGLPIPGVTVTVVGTQGIKTAVTDAEGRYTVPFLTPGAYDVRAELSGFRTAEQKGVTIALGQTATLPLKLAIGGVNETVQVTGATAVVNTTTASTGSNISSDMLERLPVGRTLSSSLYIAPGVTTSGTTGQANPSISGGTGLDNQYVIDGVNVTNTGYGALGSYSINFGSLGNATPFDFIQEVQVKTGGYQAEFGQALGGVMNVITKSGSNTLRGSLFAYGRPQGVEAGWKRYQSADFTTVQTVGTHSWDGGADFGGAIVKDRLFFYTAIDPTWTTHTWEAPATRPLATLGPVDQERRSVNYAAKGTWQMNPANRVDVSFFGDPSTGFNGPQRANALRNTDTSGFSSISYGGHNQTVRYSGALTERWLVEASYARAVNNTFETPSVDAWNVRDLTVTPRIISGGIGQFEGANDSLDNQVAAKVTNVIGGHQIRYGVEYEHSNYTQAFAYSGPAFVAPNGQMTASGAVINILPDVNFGRIYQVTRATFNPSRATRQHYFDAFVQDTWRIGSRLTLAPGIRFEFEKQNGTLETLSLKNNWSPRIGATYDVLGDGRTKVYANYGRFFARVPNDLAARALSIDSLLSRADYFDANLTQPIPSGVATQTTAGDDPVTNHFVPGASSSDTIDPNIKMSYTDEVVAGVEREVLPHTSLGVSFTYRTLGRAIEDVQTSPLHLYDIGDPGVSFNYFLTNPGPGTPVTPAIPGFDIAFSKPVHKYHAVDVTLNRRFANNWSAMASYRWSRLRGNYEGYYNNFIGQSDPGITALFDFPYNDPSYTAFGYPGDIRFLGDPDALLSLDQTHMIKLFANYAVGGRLNIGVGFNAHSGTPLTPLAWNPAYNEADIPLAPVGSGMDTVDGFRSRTPFVTQTDVQLSYTLRFGRRQATLLADVFNLFNRQTTLMYDTYSQIGVNVANPNFGEPISEVASAPGPQFQPPRQIRFGVRVGF